MFLKDLEVPCKLFSSSSDPGLDCALWQLQALRDRFVAQIVNVAERHRLPIRRWQLGQRAPDHRNLIALFERGIGPRYQFVELDRVGIDFVGEPFFFSAPPTIAIDTEIATDPRQPRLEAS